MRHSYEVIRFWECDVEQFLYLPGLLPFAGTENPQEILATVARKIEHIPEERERSNIAASTAVLAGLLYSRDVITKILRQDIRHLLKRNSKILKGSVIVHILGFCEDFKCWNIRGKLRVVQAIADFRG